MQQKKRKKLRISPSQVILLGFMALILLGTLLLCLPISSNSHVVTPFLDALFTATSATCVTGLVVHDTYTYWSHFGQIIILCLIQIGGMGVVTVAVLVTALRGKKIGVRQRFIMQESIGAPQMAGIVRLTSNIVKCTLCFEGCGALLMSLRFIPRYGFLKGLWYSIFHSISAFCNAGFDLMGEGGAFSSLSQWENDPVINTVIMLLILIGGIGFLTWEDFRVHRFHLHAYHLQSKLTLSISAILLIFPLLFFLLYEFRLPTWNGLSLSEKIWAALFQTVTPRTAGFNTVDLSAMSEPSVMIMMLLMLVGGSPGSTAGGFKTTTLASLVLSVRCTLLRKDGVQAFGRRLEESVLSRAALLITLYVSFALAGGIAISIIDGISLLAAFFETFSAIATVGLSLGMTPTLCAASHIILICLMYFGRVGGLTIVYALARNGITTPGRMPQEHITIG